RHTSFSREWSSDVCSSDLNEAYTGRPYRYVYSISFGEFDDPARVSSNTLLSHDVETGNSESYSFGENWVTGEVIFVAREGAQARSEERRVGRCVDLRGGRI